MNVMNISRDTVRPGYFTVVVCGGCQVDELTVDHWLDRLLEDCDNRKRQMILVQADTCMSPANAFASRWGWLNESVFNVVRSAELALPITCAIGLAWHYPDLCLCFCRPGNLDTPDLVRVCQAAKVPVLFAYDEGQEAA